MKKITLVVVFLLTFLSGFSQTTVTVGLGTSASGTNDNGNPVYRSSTASSFAFSQSVQLLSSADLGAAGVTSGATITKIAYYKTTAFTLGAGRTADLKIYLKNSSNSSLLNTQNMATWTTGSNLCYSNPAITSAEIPNVAGWVEFTLTTPFSYSGGGIEVAIDWAGDAATSGLSTGAFQWQYTTSTNVQAVGTSSGTVITGNLTSTQSRLYNTQLTFTNSPCSGVPAPGNTNATSLTPCPGSTVTFSQENPTIGSGVTYQWFKDTVLIPGATNGTYSEAINALGTYYSEVTCGGNTTATSPVTVSPLIINTFPWLETFDTFLPNCWQAADNGDLSSGPATFGSSSWAADGFGNDGTTGSARYEIWLAAANDWIISPLVAIPASGYELKFDAAVTQWSTTAAPTTAWESDDYVEILVSTGFTNWTVLHTFNDGNVPSTTGDAYVVDLDAYAGQNVYFAVRVVEGTANGSADLNFYIDNFQIRLTPSCAEPLALMATNPSLNSIDLTWTESGTATEWEVQYGTSGFVLGTGTIVSNITVNNPYTLSGLMSNTNYDVYVKAVCSSSDSSPWSTYTTFKTECGELTEYSEDFEAYATGSTTPMPDCWGKLGTGLTYVTTGSVAPMSPAKRLYFSASGTTPTQVCAVLPAVSNLQANTHRLKFKAYSTSANEFLSVGYLSDPSDIATFIQLTEVFLPSTAASTAQEFIIVPTGIPAGVKHLAILNPGSPAGTTIAYVDDVVWQAIPACPEPTTLMANGITSSTANLGWTEMGSAALWNVEYGPVGYTQGTGGTVVSGVATNPYTLTGLMPATTYDYYVQADCGGTDGASFWIGPYTFTTACVAFTVPFAESFSTGALPLCWTSLNPTTTSTSANAFWKFSGSPGYGASTSANGRPVDTYAWVDASTPNTGENMVQLVSPSINLTGLVEPYVEFDWFKNHSTSSTSTVVPAYDDNSLTVEINDGTGWVTIFTSTSNDPTWRTEGIALASTYVNTTVNLRFTVNKDVAGNGYFYDDLLVDEIKVKEKPSCLVPNALSASNITSSSAILSWTEVGSATTWNIEYGPVGYTQGTGGTVVSGVTANPYTLSMLASSTTFDYYVQADCGGTDGASIWSDPFTFTTECSVFTAPYTEGFETAGNLPNCWSNTGTSDTWQFNNSGTGHIGNAGTITGTTTSGNYFAWVDDSGATSPDVTLTSPLIDVSSLTLPRLTFFELSNNEGFLNAELNVSVWDGAAWNPMAMYNTNTNNGWEKKTIDLSALTITGPIQIRFVVTEQPSDFYDDIAIDDVTIDESPSTPPICATNVVAVPNTSCGNEPTVITWDAAALADGYYMTMGTTAGGNDVLDNVNIGAAATYSYIGAPNTTYYYTVSPFNASGTATGCAEMSFVTAMNGCYCFPAGTSSATYVDNFSTTLGSTNITNNVSGLSTGNYGDFTSLSTTLASTQSFNFNVEIVGGTLGCAIWIDWDNDFSFDPADMVYSTTSYGNGPFTGTITIPASTANGNYRMRVLVDYNDLNPGDDDACSFTSGRGEVEDYTVTVDNTLSSQGFDTASFVAYPNPIRDVLNLSYSTEIASVKVINLLGQVVLSRKVENTSTQIDMAGLSAGTYIVNVTIDDIVKSIKVIKN